MVHEPFLINPPARLSGRLRRLRGWSYVPIKRRRVRRFSLRRPNPVGETLTVIGGNPMNPRRRYRRAGARRRKIFNPLAYVGVLKSKGRGHYEYRYVSAKGKRKRKRVRRNAWFNDRAGHRRAALKGWRRRKRKGYRRNPMHYDNPRRYYRRRHYRRYRRNPAVTIGGVFGDIMNIGNWLPLAITGGFSVATTAVLPNMIAPGMIAAPTTGPFVKYGIQLVSAFGGGALVGNFVGKRHGDAWVITSVAYVGYQLLRDWVFKPFIPQLAVGLGEYEQYYSAHQPFEEVGAEATGYGVHAFPGEISAYPEEVSAYPYSGGYGY